MWLNKIQIYYTILIVLNGFNVFTQNIKTDLSAINSMYQKTEKFSMTLELNMFENYQTQKIYFTQSGTLQKYGENTFQKFDDNEFINTPNYSVIVDKEEKEIVYAPKKNSSKSSNANVILNLDSVLLFCKKHSFKKISNELAYYDFLMLENYPDYNQITMYFNPSTLLIQKIIFYCDEEDISINNEKEKLAKARIEFNYKDINIKPTFTKSDFTYERYLIKQGNKMDLKPFFKLYNLTVLSF